MADQGTVQPGDVTQRVGVEVIRARGVDVEKLIKMLIANAAAEFASTYYYYTILRMHLAGHEDYKEICEDARLEDRAHWELIVPRIYELGGELPNDLPAFHDQAGCDAAKLPNPPTVVNILTLLLESERCAIRSWSEMCDMTFGKDPRTYDMAARILNEEVEHEAWFIELLAHERDGKSIPSGHFRRGTPGDAPYSKNRGLLQPIVPESSNHSATQIVRTFRCCWTHPRVREIFSARNKTTFWTLPCSKVCRYLISASRGAASRAPVS